eukprot:1161370-Pyramimonas_sp.AAC.1
MRLAISPATPCPAGRRGPSALISLKLSTIGRLSCRGSSPNFFYFTASASRSVVPLICVFISHAVAVSEMACAWVVSSMNALMPMPCVLPPTGP